MFKIQANCKYLNNYSWILLRKIIAWKNIFKTLIQEPRSFWYGRKFEV